MTPTAAGLVFFGDLGGNFYAIDAATGQKLWGQKIGGCGNDRLRSFGFSYRNQENEDRDPGP